MGRRSEQRIAILIPVIVRGSDARGIPFELKAETCDVSVDGARLRGLADVAAPGNKIEVECKGKKAWYRINWVGKARTLSANQVGIRLLEPGKYIWSIAPKQWAPDSFESASVAGYDRSSLPPIPRKAWQVQPAVEDRLRFPRKPSRIETQITGEDSFLKQPGKITDISLGGCYVEMRGLLPINSAMELDFVGGDTQLHLSGIVRSSQLGFAIGIEFTGMGPVEFEKLRGMAPPTSAPVEPARMLSRATMPQSVPQPTPQTKAAASAPSYQSSWADHSRNHMTTTAQALEAVMRVLFGKGLLTRVELCEEFETLKTAKVESVG